MSKPPWISYNKKRSCKWCFHLRQLNGEVECAVHHWRKICPAGYFLERRQANTLNEEFWRKAKQCFDFAGEVFLVEVEEKHK